MLVVVFSSRSPPTLREDAASPRALDPPTFKSLLLPFPCIYTFSLYLPFPLCHLWAEEKNIGLTQWCRCNLRSFFFLTLVRCCLRSDVLKWHRAIVRAHLCVCSSCLLIVLPGRRPCSVQQNKPRLLCKSWFLKLKKQHKITKLLTVSPKLFLPLFFSELSYYL